MRMSARTHHPGRKNNNFGITFNGEYKEFTLFEIAVAMKQAGLSEKFITESIRYGLDFEGIADLIRLWGREEDEEEKKEIVADIQDMLDTCVQKGSEEEVYIKFNELDKIAKNIRCFKDSLLQIVNEQGGISNLSNLTGIPQSSLSRFFNSNAMPHRSTLLKIAKALELERIKMELLWTK